MTHDELLEDIKTEAGKELVSYMNNNYGSSIWGKVKESVIAIEKELCKHENTTWDGITCEQCGDSDETCDDCGKFLSHLGDWYE
jgi:hypothetical protein